MDAQGYLREVKGEHVYPTDWKEKREALKYIDILKVNEQEAEVLTGHKDPKKAARQLAEWGSQGNTAHPGKPWIAHLRKRQVLQDSGLSSQRGGRRYRMRRYIRAGIPVHAQQRLLMRRSRVFCRRHVYHQAGKSGPFSGSEEDIWNILRTSKLKAKNGLNEDRPGSNANKQGCFRLPYREHPYILLCRLVIPSFRSDKNVYVRPTDFQTSSSYHHTRSAHPGT